jgi:carbonic anhydrase
MQAYERLLLENKAWAAERKAEDPLYFEKLSEVQQPDYLWIGCSDSRVPANEITGTQPGEIFVHRNVANMVVHTDINLLTVLEYAVMHLQVKHVIVCGHYGCGGVKAAASKSDFGIINSWLTNIKEVYTRHKDELDAIADEDERCDRLVELNVIEQVKNLSKNAIIQKAWKKGRSLHLHGWVYGLKDGIIKPVFDMKDEKILEPIYNYEKI